MIQRRYLFALALGTLLWCGLYFAFIWTIDPYGVSPVRIAWEVNKVKPKRLDIDRLIKPYEVWRYQPRSVFLGTSRIHQAIDPAVLDGSKYAPAYNASIPGSFLNINAAHLEQYFQLDPNLKYVFVELFLYNFVFPSEGIPKMGLPEFLRTLVELNFSGTVLLDSAQTIQFNRGQPGPVAYIHARGYWVRPPDVPTNLDAVLYTDAIMKTHKQIADMNLQPTAFEALDRMVETCRKNGATLFLLITPNYPYDDYRLLSLGYWPLLEEWHRKLAGYANVISFSQYHHLTTEPSSGNARYWYDTLHFSMNMGRLMLNSFLGNPDPGTPRNMMVPVNAQNVEKVLDERRQGLARWMARNQAFVATFESGKVAAKLGPRLQDKQ